jgi:glycerol kinase
VTETTALGAAYLDGLAAGVYRDTGELAGLWKAQRRFEPARDTQRAADAMARWEHAVRQATAK